MIGWPATVLLAATLASRGLPPCAPVRGVDSVLRPGSVLLFGEMHGTRESPAFVADVLCRAAARRVPTTLALEWPADMSAALNAYLDSDGDAASRRALFAHPYWKEPIEDGRRSAAMLALLERARALRRAGADLRVFAFSVDAPSSRSRDSAMAVEFRAALAGEEGRVIVAITGNVHSRLAVGTPFDSLYRPMGFLLAQAASPWSVHGFDASYDDGSAWICTEVGCGVTALRGRSTVPRGELRTTGEIDRDGYDGRYGLGRITPSPPAVRDVAPSRPRD